MKTARTSLRAVAGCQRTWFLGSPFGGKRSAVAVVNDSPAGCQSCDRTARRRLSCNSMTERGILIFEKQISAFRVFYFKIPTPLRPGCAGPPLPKGEARAFLTCSETAERRFLRQSKNLVSWLPPLGELSCDSMTERAFLIFAKQISDFRGFSLKIPNPLRPGCAGPPLPKGEARAF